MPRRLAFPWSRISAPRICWPEARERRWFRCWITCSLPIAKRGRVLQNIGGIANLTAIPAGAAADAVIAFDTGPGNMVIDWLAQELFDKNFDRNGSFAAQGTVLAPVLAEALRNPYFKLKPPRTAGREQFGRELCGEVSRRVPQA